MVHSLVSFLNALKRKALYGKNEDADSRGPFKT